MRTISSNGIKIAYEMAGDGPTAVFIGGMDMSVPVIKSAYADYFAQNNYRALVLGLRGMPPSDVPPPPYSVAQLVEDCDAALRALGVEECFLVGASLGAFVSQELALSRPAGKKGMALIATTGRQTAWLKMLSQAELEMYEECGSACLNYVAAADLLQLFAPDELVDDDNVKQAAFFLKSKDYLAPGRRALMAAAAAYDNRVDALAGITTPTLVFSFRHDVKTPAALGKEVAERIAGSRHVVLESAGHGGIFTQKDRLNAETLRFFNGLR